MLNSILFNFVGLWCNGNTTDFDSVVSGSSPDRPANISALGEMDIISVFETEGGSSILSGPAKILYPSNSVD
jgi:hypothetical protein